MSVITGAPNDRASATRELLIRTAERLIAERGLAAVSNRQVAEAAGQANNSAVAYHIGTRDDLVLAVMRSHAEPMERLRARMVDAATGSTDVYDHVACLVRPLTDHLAELGAPSYFARFAAHVLSDPAMRTLIERDRTWTPSSQSAAEAIASLMAHVPAPVATARSEMARAIVASTCARHEQVLAEKGGSAVTAWTRTGDMIIDALTGLISAPVRPSRRPPRPRSAAG